MLSFRPDLGPEMLLSDYSELELSKIRALALIGSEDTEEGWYEEMARNTFEAIQTQIRTGKIELFDKIINDFNTKFRLRDKYNVENTSTDIRYSAKLIHIETKEEIESF